MAQQLLRQQEDSTLCLSGSGENKDDGKVKRIAGCYLGGGHCNGRDVQGVNPQLKLWSQGLVEDSGGLM